MINFLSGLIAHASRWAAPNVIQDPGNILKHGAAESLD